MNQTFRYSGRFKTLLEGQGIPLASVLRQAGLRRDLFDQPRVLLSTEELFALWKAVGTVSADPEIGLKLGTATKTEQFHPSCIAALSTETFGRAIDHLARYKRLTCPEEMPQSFEGEEWVIQFRWLLAVDVEPQVLTDMCFAVLLSLARHGSGSRLSPLRVEMMQPRSHGKALERHFGCPVQCGSSRNAIVFRRSDRSLPFVTRNAELLDMLVPQFEEQLKKSEGEDSFSELVRGAIRQRLTGHRPSIDDVAADLHMSSRTLQRRLQETGLNYQGVLDQARHAMARYYLGNSVLELNEAAYLLGYEDANSFIRAFRTWEGVPPGLWRETHRSKAQIQ